MLTMPMWGMLGLGSRPLLQTHQA